MDLVWSMHTRICVHVYVCMNKGRYVSVCVCVRACRQIPELFSVIPPVSFQVWFGSRWLALMQTRWETQSREWPDFSSVSVEPGLC